MTQQEKLLWEMVTRVALSNNYSAPAFVRVHKPQIGPNPKRCVNCSKPFVSGEACTGDNPFIPLHEKAKRLICGFWMGHDFDLFSRRCRDCGLTELDHFSNKGFYEKYSLNTYLWRAFDHLNKQTNKHRTHEQQP
jgi:hypothetical protein